LKIAVFIDFDNIEIGVKTTLNLQFDIAAILEGIKERGEVVTKIAYGDWKRAGDYGRLLSQHAIRMVQRNLTPGGDKNGADINLALDALEMAFTHDHINAFVIVGGDSDFITLVEKLKQYDKKVFVVGGRQFTSLVMQRNCHEFIAYENLVGARRQPVTERRSDAAPSETADVARIIPLVKRALKVLADREVSPQLGLLKSTLLQLDSTFSERDYGASTFRDFIEKVAKTGLITLRHSGRSMLVDLPDSSQPSDDGPPKLQAKADAPIAAPAPQQEAASESGPSRESATEDTPKGAPPVADAAQAQLVVQRVREVFQRANPPPRWPMYVRQLKQYLRANDDGFDESKLGFASLLDFLRGCQREGIFRLERDRKGILRIFPGASQQRPISLPVELVELVTVSEPEADETSEHPVIDSMGMEESVTHAEFQAAPEEPEEKEEKEEKDEPEVTSGVMIDVAAAHGERAARPVRARRARRVRKPASAKPAARRKPRASPRD
jgi:uncharacterized LabA/DUF88 family protein